jgi:AraC-like DNA-binding protein
MPLLPPRRVRENRRMSRSTSLPAPPIIRLAHPLAFAAYLRHIGAPVDHHLRRQGLPVFCDDPNQFVPLHKAWAFFDATARSEDAMLGWHVGRFLGDYNLNRGLLRRVESAPTLYEALKTMAHLVSSEASQLQLGLLERRHDVLFCTHYSTFFKDIPGYASSQAYQLGIFLDLIRHFAGQQWVPDEIGIEYPSVPAVAEELFGGCRILTHQRMGYIAVPRSCLHLAAPGSDLERSGDDSLVATTRLDYVDTLGTLITPHLEEGYPSSRLAASLMDTSVRTLARRLTAHGVTYREVVDNLRFKIARDLLQSTDLPIGEVARSVGFDDPAHFTRMFRRIAGLSPRGFREEEPTRR